MKTGMDSAEPIDAKWDAVLHRGFIATEDGGTCATCVLPSSLLKNKVTLLTRVCLVHR